MNSSLKAGFCGVQDERPLQGQPGLLQLLTQGAVGCADSALGCWNGPFRAECKAAASLLSESHSPTNPDDHREFPEHKPDAPAKVHSNARKSPTVPQTQVIVLFFKTIARRASKGLYLSLTQMIISRPR